jgi:HK97 family phage prohead protease
MPYENEHACRLREPGDFEKDSFRRTSRKHKGKEYDVIMGKLKGDDSMTEQAYRYKKNKWTASEAKSHCKEHDGKFEAAKDSKSEDIICQGCNKSLRYTDIPESGMGYIECPYCKNLIDQTGKVLNEKNYKSENMETRDISPDIGELRIEGDDQPMLVGYATKYGNFYDLGWFKERIKKGAFDDVLDSDVRCLKNHNPDLILGRTTNETLRLNSNSVGLRFENDIPDTTTGRDIREEIRRGDITGCSFAFTVAEDDWKYFDDGRPSERTIVKIAQLFDVGPVVYPANPETSVVARDTTIAVRSLDAFKKKKEQEQRTDEPEERTETKDEENRKKEYECECIECKHTLKTKKHCKDVKCPECGGDMRRKERPGPGRSQENKEAEKKEEVKTEEEKKEINERRRHIAKGYRAAGRILNRVKSADV